MPPGTQMSPAMLRILARRESFQSKAAKEANVTGYEAVLKRWDPRWLDWSGVSKFIEAELTVQTKNDSETVPFRLRYIQRRIIAAEIAARRARRKPSFIILKFRKVGVTTLELALAYWQISRRPRQQCALLAHTPDDTKAMFRQAIRFWEDHNPSHRHDKTEAFAEQLELPGIGGLFISRNAGEGKLRGTTYARLHLSEVSRIKNLLGVHAGLTESRGDTSAYIWESTPNGRDGVGAAFYDTWVAARQGKNEFIPLFFPWFMDPENQTALVEPDEIDAQIRDDVEVAEIMRKFNLSKEQMKWWLAKRLSQVINGRSAQKIHEEFPLDDETCFLVSGDSYYDIDLLAACDRQTRDPIAVEDNGRLKVWEFPDPSRPAPYIMGVDPSGGTGGDDAAIVGINGRTGKQAFEWAHDRTAPDMLGSDVIPRLGRRWAHARTREPAFVVCERENHGHAVLTALLRIAGYPVECVYHHTDEAKVDAQGNVTPSKVPGWQHNAKTHDILTMMVGQIVRDHRPLILSDETIRSIRAVTTGKGGVPEFTGRDRAVAAGLAALGIPHAVEGSSRAFIGGQFVDL